MFGDGAVQRGPSGFLPEYSAGIAAAALILAVTPPFVLQPPKEGFGIIESVLYTEEWPKRQLRDSVKNDEAWSLMEDAAITHRFTEGIFMGAIDGHGGSSTMQLIKANAFNIFKDNFKGNVREALGQMCVDLEKLAEEEHLELKTKNAAERAKAMEYAMNGQIPKRQKRDYAAMTKKELKAELKNRKIYSVRNWAKKLEEDDESKPPVDVISHSGACACFLVVHNGIATFCWVGDCFGFVVRGDKAEKVTVDHCSDNVWERARIMMAGGYTHRIGGTTRALGNLMPSRVFGDCDLKVLRAEAAESLRAAPSFCEIALDASILHVGVATDGLELPYNDELKGGMHTWLGQMNHLNCDDRAFAAARLFYPTATKNEESDVFFDAEAEQ